MWYRNETIHCLFFAHLQYTQSFFFRFGQSSRYTRLCNKYPTFCGLQDIPACTQRHDTNIPMHKHFLLKVLLRNWTLNIDIVLAGIHSKTHGYLSVRLFELHEVVLYYSWIWPSHQVHFPPTVSCVCKGKSICLQR